MRIGHLFAMVTMLSLVGAGQAESLPGTEPLPRKGDLAEQMVAGIDRYLMRELAASPQKRQERWHLDFASVEQYRKSVAPHRAHLARILGVVDARVSPVELELVATTTQPAL